MATRSLRTRLFVGSLIWAGGLLAVATAIGAALYHAHPHWAPALHNSLLIFAAAVLVVVGVSHLRRSLSPFDSLRARLNAVRDGADTRIGGTYPSEVQPLVDDLNTLLEDRERRVERAVARAGDLAHGLKTPLAVLAQEAERAAAAGQHELAAVLEQQVQRMRRQIESHLAHARVSASGAGPSARCAVAESANALIRTLQRLHAARALDIAADVAPDLYARVDRADLDEMLGNLIDNACKWARSRVRVTASRAGDAVRIAVDDDGAGLEPSLRQAVLSRGVRADVAAPGSGLGLAIVRDLAAAYSGSIELDASELGGLQVRLTLPGL